jgi:glycosyltransferase involved in cell wall biosynthesis
MFSKMPSSADAMLVSVVIPTYNRAGKVVESIESVRAQTYSRWELIVVDDGSTDSTPEDIACRFGKDSRIQYVAQANRGASAARNRGIALAKGEVIAFLDSDDLYFPGFLAAHLSVYQNHPSADVVFSDLEKQAGGEIRPRFMEHTLIFREVIEGLGRGDVLELRRDLMKQVLLQEIPIKMPGTTVRSKVFRSYGLFDEEIAVAEDWVFMLTRADCLQFVYLNEVLGRIRVSEDSLHLLLKEQDHLDMIGRLLDFRSSLKSPRERSAARAGVIHLYKSLYWHYCRLGKSAKAAEVLADGTRRTYSPALLLRFLKARLAALGV